MSVDSSASLPAAKSEVTVEANSDSLPRALRYLARHSKARQRRYTDADFDGFVPQWEQHAPPPLHR